MFNRLDGSILCAFYLGVYTIKSRLLSFPFFHRSFPFLYSFRFLVVLSTLFDFFVDFLDSVVCSSHLSMFLGSSLFSAIRLSFVVVKSSVGKRTFSSFKVFRASFSINDVFLNIHATSIIPISLVHTSDISISTSTRPFTHAKQAQGKAAYASAVFPDNFVPRPIRLVNFKMAVDEEEEMLLMLLLLLVFRRRRRRRNRSRVRQRRFWVRDIFMRRRVQGDFHNLVTELRLGNREFQTGKFVVRGGFVRRALFDQFHPRPRNLKQCYLCPRTQNTFRHTRGPRGSRCLRGPRVPGRAGRDW